LKKHVKNNDVSFVEDRLPSSKVVVLRQTNIFYGSCSGSYCKKL